MFSRILTRIRKLLRERQYVMTLHAVEEMTDDELSLSEVEDAVLRGEIVARQRDLDTNEWKYRIEWGHIEVVVKIGPTGKLVFITVYRLNGDDTRR